jgi:hypothetical protein
MGNALGRLSLVLTSIGLLACGDNNDGVGKLPDAPPAPDAAVDASIDAAVLPVRLTITRNGVGVADVRVYFQNPDSALVDNGSITTDSNGDAQAVMPLGGFVTAINPFPPLPPGIPAGGFSDDLRTFAGVKPGDHLFLTSDAPLGGAATITVLAPNDATVTYEVNTTCGNGNFSGGAGSGSPAQGQITLAGCANDTVDIVIAARNNEDQEIKSSVSKFAHQIVGEDTLDVSGEDFQSAVTARFTYENARNGSSGVSVSHLVRSSRGMFSLPLVDRSGALVDGAAELRVNEPVVTDVLGVLQTDVTMNAPHTLLSWGPMATSYDVDLQVLLPDVTSDPAFDVAGDRVTWDEATVGTTPHLTFATIHVNRVEVRGWDWAIAAPYQRGEIDFPTLPTDVFDWKPSNTDRISTPIQMVNLAVDLTTPDAHGYDAVRAQIHNIAQITDSSAFITTASGRVIGVSTPEQQPVLATPSAMLRVKRGPARIAPARVAPKRLAPRAH